MSERREAPEEATLWEQVKRAIVELDVAEHVDPVRVADIVIVRISYRLIRYAAIMYLRQIARAVLRHLHKKKKDGTPASASIRSEREPMFEGDDYSLLQERYPVSHLNKDGERGYVLRDAMTEEDWDWNCDQLEMDGGNKIAHASQLQRWGNKIKGFKRKRDKGGSSEAEVG